MSESTHFRVINQETTPEEYTNSELGLIMTEEAQVEVVAAVGMESETGETQKAADVETRMMCDVEETMAHPPNKTDSPSRRKGHTYCICELKEQSRSRSLNLPMTIIHNVFQCNVSLCCRQEKPPSWF